MLGARPETPGKEHLEKLSPQKPDAEENIVPNFLVMAAAAQLKKEEEQEDADDKALRDELAIAPRHTLLLWPGEGALTAVPHVESVGCVVPPLATTASVGQ